MFHKIDLTKRSFDSLPGTFARLDRHKGAVRPFYRLPLFKGTLAFSYFGRQTSMTFATYISDKQGRNDVVSYASTVPSRAYSTFQHLTVWKEVA